MSLANKMAKMGTIAPLPNGGAGAVSIGGRALGPPTRMGNGRNAYMGDPGLFSFLGGVARGITGVVGGLGIPGISGAARTIGGFLGGRSSIPGASTLPGPVLMPRAMPRFPVAMPGAPMPSAARNLMVSQSVPGGRGFTVDPLAILPGGAPFISRAGAPPVPTASMGGYHLNKSSYFLMDGTFIEAGTKWVKNRRRNPGNMRALSRSLGRVKSAKRMAKSLSNITIKKVCPA